MVVVECLLEEEHAFRLVVIAAQLPVLPGETQAELAVVVVVEDLVDGVLVDLQTVLERLDVLLNISDGQQAQGLELGIVLKMGHLEEQLCHFESGEFGEARALRVREQFDELII